jgi:branched-chain amino acid transport system substrate-binding protein
VSDIERGIRRRILPLRPFGRVAVAAASVAALAGGIAGFGSATSTAASNAPIDIGFSLPLSAATGGLAKAALTGAQIFFNQTNAAGGIDGHKLILSAQDNSCNTTDGVSSIDKLLSNSPKPIAVMGAYCSVSTEAIEPIIQRAQVPLLVDTAGNNDITDKAGVGGNPWVFRWGASNRQAIGALMAYVAKKHLFKKIAVVTDNTAFGLDGSKSIVTAAKANGIQILSNDAINLSDTDFSSVIARIKAEKPDAVYEWIVYLPGAVTFYRHYGSEGLASTPLIGGVEIDGNTSSIFTQYKLHGYLDGLFTTSTNTPQAKQFLSIWKAHGQSTAASYTGYDGYQGAEILVAALKQAKSLTPAGVQQALKNLNYGPTILGGRIQFDAHDQAHDNLTIEGYTGTTESVLGLQKS